MRVISGTAGGIPLHTPRTDLRPSMEKVRGAIFDSLGDAVPGARVLDLFAGSGALGIEALSRGAASVTFVEKDRLAVATIRRNFEKTRLTGTVQAADVFSYLDRFAAPESFDLILADPPYSKITGERDFAPELINNDALRRALAPGGTFVLEHLPGSPLELGDRWECLRDKRYGATAVAFLRPAPRPAEPAS
ncbi:MAG: RsmD family RNA methyltransferase [Chthoniobacteraceae bacterium]